MGLIEVLKTELFRTYDKAEDNLLATAKRIYQTYHGEDSFVGAVGVGYKDGHFYIKGSIDTAAFKREGLENPGAKARHTVKSSLQVMLGPMPPNKGKAHRIVLLPLPSFLYKIPVAEQLSFFDGWKSLVTSYDLPYCEFTVLR